MYYRKMGAYPGDEKLLMHFFQDSLVGAVVIWYTNLEASCIRTWKDLITAFLRQYQSILIVLSINNFKLKNIYN